MKNIRIEEVNDGFKVTSFVSAAGDETRAEIGTPEVNTYADVSMLLASLPNIFQPAPEVVAIPEAPTVIPLETVTAPVETSGASN